MTITLTREEAQQVLDAMQQVHGDYHMMPGRVGPREAFARMRSAIKTLRARLSAPEPSVSVEPVACIVKDCKNHLGEGRFVGALCSPCHAFITRNEGKHSQAYRNVQREWQGLTDEQFCGLTAEMRGFAEYIEAKLKEKNT